MVCKGELSRLVGLTDDSDAVLRLSRLIAAAAAAANAISQRGAVRGNYTKGNYERQRPS